MIRQRGGHPGGRQDRRCRHRVRADTKFALARYNSDGTLDATFGVDGKVMTDFTSGVDSANGVAIQADGKIVVVGPAGSYDRNQGRTKFALARYNSDGTLDATFGGDGKVMTDFTSGGTDATGVAIQADGKIVAVGVAAAPADVAADSTRHSRFALARYNSDGTLDASFGVNGKVMTDFCARGDAANGVAIQADGKIVAVGVTADRARSSQVRPRPLQQRRHPRRDLRRERQGRDRLHPERRRGRSASPFKPTGGSSSPAGPSGRSKMKVALARYLGQ